MGIELKNVSKSVDGQMHIYPTDLRIEKGQFNVLLGTTLSGKTTLMRLMAGLDRPTHGEVWFEGANVTGIPVQKRNVAMVYQAFVNYPSFTVYDNIASPLRVARVGKAEIDDRVNRIADLLKLGPMLHRLPSELSGGQQQRTALARALVKNAPLVLLDEPLANLDYKLREELRDELPKLFADTGATVVYATSEPSEALMLGGFTATLDQGRVIEYGPTTQIYRAPKNLLSARVLSDPPINTAEIRKQDGRFGLNAAVGWPVPPRFSHLADGDYVVGIRPHHLQVVDRVENGIKVQGRVLVAEINGSQSIVHTSFEGNNWISESHGIHTFKVGDQVDLFVNVDRCLYFDKDGVSVRGDASQLIGEASRYGQDHARQAPA